MKAFVVKRSRTIFVSRAFRAIRVSVLVLLAGGTAAYLATILPESKAGHDSDVNSASPATVHAEKVRRDGKDGIVLPADMTTRMGLRTATAELPTHPIRLSPFQGVLALDNDRLSRVHCRFAGEVMEIGSPADSPSAARPFRVGDRVRKGDLLAVVWCKDLGEKKSELADALSTLKLNRDNLTRYKSLTEGIIPLKQIREAEAAVRSTENAAAKAEATLRSWRLSEDEIKALIARVDKLDSPDARREWATEPTWARVEIRAAQGGTILEKNLSLGDIVDTTATLFVIGDLSHLTIWAHVYEEDLSSIQALPQPIRWTVTVPSRPGTAFPGTLDQIGAVIDSAQHTALVSGQVDNPNGSLKAGQFVTVAVELPPPSGELELPTAAVVEDGRESLVFVHPDPREPRFVRHPVEVLRRYRETVYVRSTALGLQPGSRVVTSGALLLRDAMDQIAVVAAK